MGETKRFVIRREGYYELTTVGRDGSRNIHNGFPLDMPPPRGQLLADEDAYRSAIEEAEVENMGSGIDRRDQSDPLADWDAVDPADTGKDPGRSLTDSR